jgi:putative heme transporter
LGGSFAYPPARGIKHAGRMNSKKIGWPGIGYQIRMSNLDARQRSYWNRQTYQGRPKRPPSEKANSAQLKFGIERGAAYAWRVIAIGVVALSALWLIGRLLVVVVPMLLSVLLLRALSPVSRWLQRHRWRNSLAAAATLSGFVVVLIGIVGAASAGFASQFGELKSTVSEGIKDIETWLVETESFRLDRADIEAFRDRLSNSSAEFLTSSQGVVANGAISMGKVILGFILTLIVTFFLLKDGDKFWGTVRSWFLTKHHSIVQRSGQRAWDALGSYLRGATILGAFEATVIGATLAILRASLIVPVVLITMIAAFVPIAGATLAGVVAVLVALVTVGPTGAIIMAVVALVLQQLDNDLLAPIIYGRALRIHALTILLGITAGGALFGFVGSVFAVPILAVVLNVANEIRGDNSDPSPVEPSELEVQEPQNTQVDLSEVSF